MPADDPHRAARGRRGVPRPRGRGARAVRVTPRERFAAARVARLATSGPHIVPICFALDGDTIWSAVDAKPKRTRALRRLENIARDPRVSVLTDHYDDSDWSRLWWARADGTATVHDDAPAAR